MNIFNYFKKKGIDTVDPSFYRKIAEWISWYEGNVRNFSFYKVYSGRGTYKRCRRKSMGMAKKLSEDIADLLLNERVTITLDDDQTDEYVQQVLDDNRFLVMGNDYQERKALLVQWRTSHIWKMWRLQRMEKFSLEEFVSITWMHQIYTR